MDPANPIQPIPVPVTADWADPLFERPFIELDEQRTEPEPHRYVHGGFEGTDARFSFYFPAAERYCGRFFHNTYPMATTSDIGPFPIAFEVATGDLAFTLDSGAFYVQTNNGGVFRNAAVDPSIAAWRVNAAAAKFARVVAERVYGAHRCYGYLFGGSGGAYQTMGAAENTDSIWDGFVPFVPGCNHAIPSMFTVRMNALRILRERDRFPGIVDALEPGGSGDPYADLDAEEAEAFREVSRMGFPLRGWYGHAAMDSGYFANISGMIPAMDPGYAEDFWSQPGYLGSDPAASIQACRQRFPTTVAATATGSRATITIVAAPESDMANSHVVVISGDAAGASLPVARQCGTEVALVSHLDPAVIEALKPGDAVALDNSWALALETYHRHQVPGETEYLGWNQFRDAKGNPRYPQRPVQVGPAGTANSAGSVLTGNVHGKVLMLACLLDIDSFPWQADWYRGQARARLGDRFEDTFALWFIENAHHENPMTSLARAHAVSYGPALKQALRDLAGWVERGVKPCETRYQVVDAQVIVPATASKRGGVQPVIQLVANGGECAEVAVGQPVRFEATVAVPPGQGRVVAVEWDFDGSGDFPHTGQLAATAEEVRVEATHAYSCPGIYFAVLRAASHRTGDGTTPHCRIQNLARVRIVVR